MPGMLSACTLRLERNDGGIHRFDGKGCREAVMVSVIVPFRNAEKTLAVCLRSLSVQAFDDAEFILVDNNSTDGSVEVVKSFLAQSPGFRARLFHEARKGPAAARNCGAAQASGDWLAFTDADCECDAAWLADLTASTKGIEKLGAVAGSMRPARSGGLVAKMLGAYALPPNSKDAVFGAYELVRGGFPTANLMVKRSVFEAVGGFDTHFEFAAGEDHDLCRRIYRAGHVIKAVTGAVVNHIHRDDVCAMLHQAFLFGYSHAVLLSQEKDGAFIVELFSRVCRIPACCRVWLDFRQADKKLIALMIPAVFWYPLFLLSALYLVYLSLAVHIRCRGRDVVISPWQAPVAAVLLIARSIWLGAGRIYGSLRCGVLCV